MTNHRTSRYAARPAGWLLALLLGGLFAVVAQAQSAAPGFAADAVSVRDDGQTRLDLYTKLPYAQLNFLKSGQGFKARYTVTADIYTLDEEGHRQNLIESRIWNRSVRAENFAATQSDKRFDPTTQSLELRPGRYLVAFQVEDAASEETLVHELPVQVRDLREPLALSGLLLLDEYDAASNTIFPSVTNRIGTDQTELRVFYELYAEQPREVRVTREVLRLKSSSGFSSVRSLLGLSEKGDETEVVFTETKEQHVAAGRTQAVTPIPMDAMRVGDYAVRVTVNSETGRQLAAASKGFSVQWSGLAQHIQQLSAAIDQLQYVAKGDEYKKIKQAKSREQQLRLFRQFWKKRDPTPSTSRNERMAEYYQRISLANNEYGQLTNGWKTDRGHVQVLFGEPDYIERHPYNVNADPYQVWYYYRVGKQFIFVDQTGLGDYELLVPIWDERTRIR